MPLFRMLDGGGSRAPGAASDCPTRRGHCPLLRTFSRTACDREFPQHAGSPNRKHTSQLCESRGVTPRARTTARTISPTLSAGRGTVRAASPRGGCSSRRRSQTHGAARQVSDLTSGPDSAGRVHDDFARNATRSPSPWRPLGRSDKRQYRSRGRAGVADLVAGCRVGMAGDDIRVTGELGDSASSAIGDPGGAAMSPTPRRRDRRRLGKRWCVRRRGQRRGDTTSIAARVAVARAAS